MVREDTTEPKHSIPAFKDLRRENDCGTKASDILFDMWQDMKLELCQYSVGIDNSPEVQNVVNTDLEVFLWTQFNLKGVYKKVRI